MTFTKCNEDSCKNKAVFNTGKCFLHTEDKQKLLTEVYDFIKKNNVLKGYNFSNIPFTGIDFIDKDISFSIFSRTECKDINFSGSTIVSTFFDFADLTGANFSNSMIQFSVFGGSVLKKTNFDESTVYSSNFLGADLDNVVFKNADLSYSRFFGNNLKNTSFRNCNLKKTFFEKIDFDEITVKTSNYQDSIHLNCKQGICIIERGAS